MSLRLIFVFLLCLAPVLAQAPRVSSIDFYGLRHVKEDRIRKALGFKEGDPLPAARSTVEDHLEEVPDLVRAHLEAICCEPDGGVTLYVGIEEKGAPHFELRDPPDGAASLPETVMENYDRFLHVLAEASRGRETAEDLSQGHSLIDNREARTLQEVFIGYASVYGREAKNVLRESADERQRAAAAYIIGYSADKAAIIPDLQYALTDSDDAVRTNAIRGLTAIATLASRKPELLIRVQPTWFVEMLNSLLWSDRRQAAKALVTLTESRDQDLLATIRERALPASAEMARWKHLDDALPSFILLGRIGGRGEEEIQQAWVKGDRAVFIQQVLKPPKKKAE
jgi:hypothetical protein